MRYLLIAIIMLAGCVSDNHNFEKANDWLTEEFRAPGQPSCNEFDSFEKSGHICDNITWEKNNFSLTLVDSYLYGKAWQEKSLYIEIRGGNASGLLKNDGAEKAYNIACEDKAGIVITRNDTKIFLFDNLTYVGESFDNVPCISEDLDLLILAGVFRDCTGSGCYYEKMESCRALVDDDLCFFEIAQKTLDNPLRAYDICHMMDNKNSKKWICMRNVAEKVDPELLKERCFGLSGYVQECLDSINVSDRG